MPRSSRGVLHKQVSVFLPIEQWRALRAEAARKGVPITDLIATWIEKPLAACQKRHGKVSQ